MRRPREHSRIIPSLEVPDVTAGELHFMAQIETARRRGRTIPRFADLRVDELIERLAGETA